MSKRSDDQRKAMFANMANPGSKRKSRRLRRPKPLKQSTLFGDQAFFSRDVRPLSKSVSVKKSGKLGDTVGQKSLDKKEVQSAIKSPTQQLKGWGITVQESMTTPTRPGKKPRPVWVVSSISPGYDENFRRIGGRKFRGMWSFWSDPTEDLAEDISREGKLDFAGRQEALKSRAESRAERYQDWAGKASKRSEEAYKRSTDLSRVLPFGQPILVGHHSEGRHRRLIRDMDRAMGRSAKEGEKAEYLRSRAEASEKTAKGEYSTAFMSRRIKEAEARIRKMKRDRAVRSDKSRVDVFIQEDEDQVKYWKQKIKEAGGVSFNRSNISPGNSIKYMGTWYKVKRVNPKSVTIKNWLGVESFTWKVPYPEIKEVK